MPQRRLVRRFKNVCKVTAAFGVQLGLALKPGTKLEGSYAPPSLSIVLTPWTQAHPSRVFSDLGISPKLGEHYRSRVERPGRRLHGLSLEVIVSKIEDH